MKIDDTIRELMSKEIDGVILPAEADALGRTLSGNPSARKLRDDLLATTAMLGSVHEVKPPAGFVKSVMRSLEGSGSPAAGRVFHGRRLVESLRHAFTLDHAYALAGGLIGGALVVSLFFMVFNQPSVDPSSVSGTLIMSADNVDVNLDNVKGTITMGRSDAVQSIDLRLNSQDQVSARIAFDPRAIRVEGVKRLEDRASTLNVQGGEIEIQGSGKIGYRVSLSAVQRPAPEVVVSLFSGGRLVYQKQITIVTQGN